MIDFLLRYFSSVICVVSISFQDMGMYRIQDPLTLPQIIYQTLSQQQLNPHGMTLDEIYASVGRRFFEKFPTWPRVGGAVFSTSYLQKELQNTITLYLTSRSQREFFQVNANQSSAINSWKINPSAKPPLSYSELIIKALSQADDKQVRTFFYSCLCLLFLFS